MELGVYEFHSLNHDQSSPGHNVDGAVTPNGSDVRYCKFDRKDTDRLRFCWGLCCLKGCIIGTLGLLYFIFIVPLGMILVMHGHNQGHALTLWLGVGLLTVTTIGLPGSYIFYRWQRHRRKLRDQETRRQKARLARENQMLSSTPQDEQMPENFL